MSSLAAMWWMTLLVALDWPESRLSRTGQPSSRIDGRTTDSRSPNAGSRSGKLPRNPARLTNPGPDGHDRRGASMRRLSRVARESWLVDGPAADPRALRGNGAPARCDRSGACISPHRSSPTGDRRRPDADPRGAGGAPAAAARAPDPRDRRRDGHADPELPARRGGLSRPGRAVPRPPARPPRQQRPAVADAAGDRPGDPRRLSRRRRRHHRDEHVHGDPHRPGRLRPRGRRSRDERRGRPDRARGRGRRASAPSRTVPASSPARSARRTGPRRSRRT